MSILKIEDFKFSSSSIDEFFGKEPERKHTSSVKVRVANVNSLSGFKVVSADTLVHISQQDFWKLGKDNEGYFIERLVEDNEGPIKE